MKKLKRQDNDCTKKVRGAGHGRKEASNHFDGQSQAATVVGARNDATWRRLLIGDLDG